MIKNSIAPHETFEIHELLAFKNNMAAKTATSLAMVSDPRLKDILQWDLSNSQQCIRDLRDLFRQSDISNFKSFITDMHPDTGHQPNIPNI